MPIDVDEAPLFPLPRGAILPGELLPLHIFEPRYQAMMRAVRAEAQIIAIGTLESGWERDYLGKPPVARIVGLGSLLRDEENADGTSDIVLHGAGRGRLVEELPSEPFRRVRFEFQASDEEAHPMESFRLRRELLQGLAACLAQDVQFDVTARFDVGALADRIASALQLPPRRRVQMMQAFTADRRIDVLLELLGEPRHARRLVELIPSLGDFTLALPDAKDLS